MREVVFLRKNEKKWRQAEQALQKPGNVHPDMLAELFIELSDDLAYAQTNYPESNTTVYLNGLLAELYQAIYHRRKGDRNRFVQFWMYDLPLEFRRSHRFFLYSFLIFFVSVLIGVVSTAYDDSFPRIVLGDAYVNQTLENIDKGDPLAIYKSPDAGNMWFDITLNNIKVSFIAFVSGLIFMAGTVTVLFKNGVMLGSFQWFFKDAGHFQESLLTIWIHGTIEISAIIIAGAAGILLGYSFMFPGTYSRKIALIKGAKRGVNIITGLIPLFIVAGFLESYFTRHTEWHWSLRLLIILLSLLFVLYYFVIRPIQLERGMKNKSNQNT